MQSVPLGPPPTPTEAPARAFRFSRLQIDAISAAYSAGATMASLAAEYNVKRQSISALLKREGVPIRARKTLSPDQADEAVRLYGTGLSCASIGDRLGFDSATIWRALRAREVQMRSPNEPHAERRSPSPR